MKPIQTLLILGASTLAFGFTPPVQDAAESPFSSAIRLEDSTDPLPYSRKRPATIVIRYDPSRIYLTHALVAALLQPVRAMERNDPSQSLNLMTLPGAERQPPGVFIGRVHLHPKAPQAADARERLLTEGLSALEESLVKRITVPNRNRAMESKMRYIELADDASKQLSKIAKENATHMTVASLKSQAVALAKDSEMLQVELAAINTNRQRGRANIETGRALLNAAEAETHQLQMATDRLSQLVKSGVASNQELSKTKTELAQARASLAQASNNISIGAAELSDLDAMKVQLTNKLEAAKASLEDLKGRVNHGGASGKASDVTVAARVMELDVAKASLQSKLERLRVSIANQDESLMLLTPVTVERW